MKKLLLIFALFFTVAVSYGQCTCITKYLFDEGSPTFYDDTNYNYIVPNVIQLGAQVYADGYYYNYSSTLLDSLNPNGNLDGTPFWVNTCSRIETGTPPIHATFKQSDANGIYNILGQQIPLTPILPNGIYLIHFTNGTTLKFLH